MTKYQAIAVSPPRLWIADDGVYDYAQPKTMDVIVQEHGPVDTGLLDEHGVKLFRVEDKQPIGFVRSHER